MLATTAIADTVETPGAQNPQRMSITGITLSNYSVSCVDNTATLTIHNWMGVFPVSMTYRLNKVPCVVNSFADIPAQAEEMLSYHASLQNMVEFEFTVNAFEFLADLTPAQSVTYTVHVYANYTLGRNALIAAVNARRNGPHIF